MSNEKEVFYYLIKNSLNLLCKLSLDNYVIGALEIIEGK